MKLINDDFSLISGDWIWLLVSQSVIIFSTSNSDVDKTFITEGEEGFRIAKVRIRDDRTPLIGDKFCSRCGQKGTIGLVIEEANMPFTEDGIRPDIIINPHALPSRMTIGQLLETVMGKAACEFGTFAECTAFNNTGSKYKWPSVERKLENDKFTWRWC